MKHKSNDLQRLPSASEQAVAGQAVAGVGNRSQRGLGHSSDRWRRRRDLQFARLADRRVGHATRAAWNVFDPLSRQSFRIGWLEHWLLTRLDERRSLSELLDALLADYPDCDVSAAVLQRLVYSLQVQGLVQSTTQASPAGSTGQTWQSRISSLVVWQIRGLQPERWLRTVATQFDWLFSMAAVKIWMLLSVLTICWVALEFQQLRGAIAAWQFGNAEWLFNPVAGGLLMVVFLVTRGLHELGHALVSTRFGVRVPDIGLFVILGAPCVYCDVSESWKLPFRWQRAAVAAAGMYTELVVATVAAWIWLATVDGPIHELAMQTMFVCSVSTLLINVNPLMRFDGYYILADWLDEVNLRGTADRIGKYVGLRLLLGPQRGTSAQQPLTFRQRGLCLFSAAGWLYRAALSLTIAAALVQVYAGWNLLWLGRVLAGVVLVSWWGVPLVKTVRELFAQCWQYGQWLRPLMLGVALSVVVALVPLPSRRFASGWVQPELSQGVFVSRDAEMLTCVTRDGEIVRAGQPLFRLRNRELELQLLEREQAAMSSELRQVSMRRQLTMHARDIDLMPYAADAETSRSLAEATREQLAALELTAPISGRVIAHVVDSELPPGHAPNGVAGGALDWCSPLQTGRSVGAGTRLVSIGSGAMIAILPLTDEQLSDVAVGTPAKLRLSHRDSQVVWGTVDAIVAARDLASPWALPHALPQQAAATLSQASSTAESNGYAAVVQLQDSAAASTATFPIGSSVDAIFHGPSQTLYQHARRWLRANLRLLTD